MKLISQQHPQIKILFLLLLLLHCTTINHQITYQNVSSKILLVRPTKLIKKLPNPLPVHHHITLKLNKLLNLLPQFFKKSHHPSMTPNPTIFILLSHHKNHHLRILPLKIPKILPVYHHQKILPTHKQLPPIFLPYHHGFTTTLKSPLNSKKMIPSLRAS